MGKIKVDYIIVGQGIAGSWLALELIKRGFLVQVMDKGVDQTSSLRAAGIYNPVTGRKMVKTWRADELFSNLENDYYSLEKLVGKSFLHPIPIYRPFSSIGARNDWEGRAADKTNNSFLSELKDITMGYDHIHDPYGGIVLKNSGYVEIPNMIKAVKALLRDKGIYHEKVFDYSKATFGEGSCVYEDIVADKIILCDGVISSNPFWNLPFRPVRGEIIDIKCELESKHIINQGVFMIPKNGRYSVGSTYDHNNLTYEPQESGIRSLEERLRKLYKGDYKIIDKRAGVRPATHDRKPYIGLHSKYKTLGIFNGFGTKGVSLAPYFAKHFADVLQGKCEIDKEVDVQRVI